MIWAYIILTILWLALIAYAVLGGADFGAGVWDLFAFGDKVERKRELINQALGPVWEANHVWLIFLIVGLFTAFPVVFATLSVVLFVPFTLALIGIVLRGAAFVFRTHGLGRNNPITLLWSRVFSFASTITPFFLGVAAAAVASGRIRAQGGNVQADVTGATWLSPFALTIGFMAVSLCAVLAAVYLTVEAQNTGDEKLVDAFRWRAIIAGAVTAVLGALGLVLSPSEAPILWDGMLAHAIPLLVVTMLVGLATAGALFLKRYRLARVLIIIEAAGLLGSWGLSQLPYLIPPDLTVQNSANSPGVLQFMLIGTIIGMALLLPSLYYLFSVFKLSYPAPGVQKKEPTAAGKEA